MMYMELCALNSKTYPELKRTLTRTPDGATSQIVRIPRERLDGAGCKNRVLPLRFFGDLRAENTVY